jgi:hypothetical protein
MFIFPIHSYHIRILSFFVKISGSVSTSSKFISRAISLWSTKDQSVLASSISSRIVADWWDFSWEFLFCRSLNFFIILFIFCGNWCAIYIIAIIECMILRIELVWTVYFLCEYFRCCNNKDFFVWFVCTNILFFLKDFSQREELVDFLNSVYYFDKVVLTMPIICGSGITIWITKIRYYLFVR